MSKLIRKTLYGIKASGNELNPYQITGNGLTSGALLRNLYRKTFATGLDSNGIFGENKSLAQLYAGTDRIGKKVSQAINNGNLSNLGRRSFRRLAKVMNANARTQEYAPMQQLTVLEKPTVESPITPVLEKPAVITKEDLTPASNEYTFGEGFTGDWANRAQLFYQANKDNPAWKEMAGNDKVITADEMKAWLRNQGIPEDAKLGRDTANKMGVSNLDNYGWMTVSRDGGASSSKVLTLAALKTLATQPYTGYYAQFKNAKAASLRRAYDYYSGGGTGDYYDEASGKTYTPEGRVKYTRTRPRTPNAQKPVTYDSGLSWAMASDPAIMLASGYTPNANGSVTHQRTEASDLLADNLSDIATMAQIPVMASHTTNVLGDFLLKFQRARLPYSSVMYLPK